MLPVSAEFGLSRADFNTGIILINFGMAITGPFIGRQLDRRSIRLVMAISAVMLGGGLVVLGVSNNLWLSAAVLAIPVAGAVVGTGTLTSTTLVARWFTAYRGRAMAIATIGISLGPVVVVPLVGLLLEMLDWHLSLIVTGCTVGVLLLALVPFVRDRPGPGDVEVRSGEPAPDAAAAPLQANGGPIKLSTLLKAQPFWTIAIGSGLCFGVHQTLIVSLAPIAQEQGLSIAKSASLLSLFGAAAIAGKLLLAWLGDRIDRRLLLVIPIRPDPGGQRGAAVWPRLCRIAGVRGLARAAERGDGAHVPRPPRRSLRCDVVWHGERRRELHLDDAERGSAALWRRGV